MEFLKHFKEKGYFSSDLYHMLEKKKIVKMPETITPSVYNKEMKMSTAERLKTLNSIEIDNMVRDGNKKSEPKLSFTPRVIVFQNFKSQERIVAKFTVQNKSTAAVSVIMIFKESSYFSIKICGAELLSRLAPGMTATYAITFMPANFEDYIHKVTFKTDKGTYVLPIIAMGPRPQLDFPDEVHLDTTPLKLETTKVLAIHNLGSYDVSFTLRTKMPFTVEPKLVRHLPLNEQLDVKISLKTMRLGQCEGMLYVELETGELFGVKLLGSTFLVSLQLEKDVIRFDDTFNTMARQQTFKIINNSDYVLTYMCMKNLNVLKGKKKFHFDSWNKAFQ